MDALTGDSDILVSVADRDDDDDIIDPAANFVADAFREGWVDRNVEDLMAIAKQVDVVLDEKLMLSLMKVIAARIK